jgi:hypothetical protein
MLDSRPTLDERGLWTPFTGRSVSTTPQWGRSALLGGASPARISVPSDPDRSDDARRAGVAENESIFRRANEKLEQRFRELGAEGLTPFLCECGDARCTRTIRLSLDEYEEVRRRPGHFAIVPGHQILEAERVIEENGRYDVVEKVDVGRRVAEARDPR